MLLQIWLTFIPFGICVVILASDVHCVFKMTNVHCESFNKSFVKVNNCRLHAIRRDVATLNANVTILKPAYVIDVNFYIVKKANGYKPFIINSTFDCCKFMTTKSHPIGSIVYGLFKEFTNINHTCPYGGEQILEGFYPRHELLNLPLPDGQYGALITWFLYKQKTFITNVYFEFKKENIFG